MNHLTQQIYTLILMSNFYGKYILCKFETRIFPIRNAIRKVGHVEKNMNYSLKTYIYTKTET